MGRAAPLALLALLTAALAVMLWAAPRATLLFAGGAPDEALAVETVRLDAAGIRAQVRGDGRDDVTIAQVQVDGAYWTFVQDPPGPLARAAGATVAIPYPWVEGEAHHLRFVTATGATFDYAIEAALPTPDASAGAFAELAALGIFVGFVPVALGLFALPLLRRGGGAVLTFALALTVGLLAFLFVDTIAEGLALAEEAAGAFEADLLVWLGAALAFAGLLALSRRGGATLDGPALALWLALGIGLHNLGEGLAIGTALAQGNAALGGALVIGFTLHNLTEGIAIAAPLARARATLTFLVGAAALAGLPAVAGTWIGAFTFQPHWGALFFGVAAGAIAQVIYEVVRYAFAAAPAGSTMPATGAFAGFGAGVLVMYATGFLVAL